MNNLFSFLKDYKHLEKAIVNVIISEFFIQMVNATFMNILPLYMTRKGYSDEEIALFITFRFLGVFILAFPLGKLIPGKKINAIIFALKLMRSVIWHCHCCFYCI